MHLAQALTLSFEQGNFTHCKLGYFLFLTVGLYCPLSFLRLQTIIDFFSQIAHSFAIFSFGVCLYTIKLRFRAKIDMLLF